MEELLELSRTYTHHICVLLDDKDQNVVFKNQILMTLRWIPKKTIKIYNLQMTTTLDYS